MINVFLTMLLGWYGLGLLAGLVLLGAQLIGRVRRGRRPARGTGRPDRAEPTGPDAARAPERSHEGSGLPRAAGSEAVAERRQAG